MQWAVQARLRARSALAMSQSCGGSASLTNTLFELRKLLGLRARICGPSFTAKHIDELLKHPHGHIAEDKKQRAEDHALQPIIERSIPMLLK